MHYIYHHYDADGYAAAAVIVKHLVTKEGVDATKDITTISCKHGNSMNFNPDMDINHDTIYIVDYSFTQQTDIDNVIRLFEAGYNIIWIDHHKTSEDIIKENGGKKFDVVLMNPPYLGKNRNDYNIHLKFLNKIATISNNIISVQPIMFLFKTYDKKSPEKTEKEILSTIETYGVNVEEIDGKEFDAAFGNKIGIININKMNDDTSIVIDNKKYNSTNEINKFSHDNLIVEFNNIVKNLYKQDNIANHWQVVDKRNIKLIEQQEKDSKSDKWYVSVASIRGNKGSDDMATLIPKDRIPEYGNRPNFYINFNSKNLADNFINYAKTDFCSCCIYLFKNDLNLGNILRYVPWFDFSDKHFSKTPKEIDDYLFKKYNISDDIRKHIEEVLPDYYGIRKQINI